MFVCFKEMQIKVLQTDALGLANAAGRELCEESWKSATPFRPAESSDTKHQPGACPSCRESALKRGLVGNLGETHVPVALFFWEVPAYRPHLPNSRLV